MHPRSPRRPLCHMGLICPVGHHHITLRHKGTVNSLEYPLGHASTLSSSPSMSHGAYLPPYPLHLFNIRGSLQSNCMSTADDIFMGSRQFRWKPLLGFSELLNGTCTNPDSKFPVFCCNWSSCQYTLCVCTSLQYQCGLLQLSCKQGERYQLMLKRMFQLILLMPSYPTTMYVVHIRAAMWTPSLTVLPQGFRVYAWKP